MGEIDRRRAASVTDYTADCTACQIAPEKCT
jgi:hypothetical protein